MAPLIHILSNNNSCYDKNVIVSIADFLFKIFILLGIADCLTNQFFML
jgi:hypothetical protein